MCKSVVMAVFAQCHRVRYPAARLKKGGMYAFTDFGGGASREEHLP